MHYLELAKALPIPAQEQTRAFAQFVTGAHSWYKLPIHKDTPFFFYLDPNAGRAPVHTSSGGATFVDIHG